MLWLGKKQCCMDCIILYSSASCLTDECQATCLMANCQMAKLCWWHISITVQPHLWHQDGRPPNSCTFHFMWVQMKICQMGCHICWTNLISGPVSISSHLSTHINFKFYYIIEQQLKNFHFQFMIVFYTTIIKGIASPAWCPWYSKANILHYVCYLSGVLDDINVFLHDFSIAPC